MRKPTTKPKLSFRKKAGFALLSTGLFLIGLEILLTLIGVETSNQQTDPYVGFESKHPLFVEDEGSDGGILKTASNKLTYFNPQRFAKDKPPETFRIFCLGGSTTFGRPYEDSTSFCAWLRELLAVAGRDRNFEVINAGGISYASYRVTTVMEELRQYHPDLFIIYCGHNEFLEERTYRDFRNNMENSTGMSSVLHRTSTLQFARDLISESEPSGDDRFLLPAEVDAILDHTAGPISYHRDDTLRERVLAHFEFNLNRMIQLARDAGADLLFVTPAANLKDFSPFKSEQFSGLSQSQRLNWTDLVTVAAEHQAKGEIQKSIEQLKAARSIDPRHAEVRYQLGQLLTLQRRYSEADKEFQAAVDNDICPLRATSEIGEIVRDTTAAHQVPLVDYEAILREDCLRAFGHKSPGNAYFLDHVHPRIEGHRLLAMALFEAMIQMDIVKPNELWRDDAIEITTRTIESRINPEMNSKALTNLSQVLNWAGKIEEAGRLAIEAVDLREEHQLDDDPESLFYAGKYLETSGDVERAKEYFERVLILQPDINQARWHLARLLVRERAYDEAKLELERLVDSEPENPRFLQMLGQVRIELEQFDAAIQSLKQANAIDPNLPGIRELMSYAQEQLNREAD